MLKYNIRTRFLADPGAIKNILTVENDVVPFDRAGVLEQGWGYDSNGAKSNAKGCRLVSLAVSVRLRGGPRPSRSGTYRRG